MRGSDELTLIDGVSQEGFEDSKQSVLAHRLMGEYYLHLEEYEITVEAARNGMKILAAESQKSGLKFQKSVERSPYCASSEADGSTVTWTR